MYLKFRNKLYRIHHDKFDVSRIYSNDNDLSIDADKVPMTTQLYILTNFPIVTEVLNTYLHLSAIILC